MKRNPEFEHFNKAMDQILHADPNAVKKAMEQEAHEQAIERKAKGERKRGKKPRGDNDGRNEDHHSVK